MRDTRMAKHKRISHWLMLDFVERNIRFRADQLYEERELAKAGKQENWLKALSKALEATAALSSPEISADGLVDYLVRNQRAATRSA